MMCGGTGSNKSSSKSSGYGGLYGKVGIDYGGNYTAGWGGGFGAGGGTSDANNNAIDESNVISGSYGIDALGSGPTGDSLGINNESSGGSGASSGATVDNSQYGALTDRAKAVGEALDAAAAKLTDRARAAMAEAQDPFTGGIVTRDQNFGESLKEKMGTSTLGTIGSTVGTGLRALGVSNPVTSALGAIGTVADAAINRSTVAERQRASGVVESDQGSVFGSGGSSVSNMGGPSEGEAQTTQTPINTATVGGTEGATAGALSSGTTTATRSYRGRASTIATGPLGALGFANIRLRRLFGGN